MYTGCAYILGPMTTASPPMPLLVNIPNQYKVADFLVLLAALLPQPRVVPAKVPSRAAIRDCFTLASRYRFDNYEYSSTTRRHHGQRPFDSGEMAGIRCMIAARLRCRTKS